MLKKQNKAMKTVWCIEFYFIAAFRDGDVLDVDEIKVKLPQAIQIKLNRNGELMKIVHQIASESINI